MSETQIVETARKIVPILNNETKEYEDNWPWSWPQKKPKELKITCGCCNTSTYFSTSQQYKSHKGTINHIIQVERWKLDEIEKQELRKKIKQLEKQRKRDAKTIKKKTVKLTITERELAEEKAKNAILELQLDNTPTDSEDEFEDAEDN